MNKILKKIYDPKTKTDENNRIYYFDNIKFILIFFVVFSHLISIIVPENINATRIWLFINLVTMPLFVFISGYFSKGVISRKDTSKIVNYIFIYLFLSLIVFLIYRIGYGKNTSLNIFQVKNIPWYFFCIGIWYLICMLTNNLNKKYVLIFSIILSLIVGYDKNIGDYLGLSRIITFFPFFLLGTMFSKENIEFLTNNKKIKIISLIILAIAIYVFIAFIREIYFIRPITTGRNSYFILPKFQNYGAIIRGMWYIVSSIVSIGFMNIIPKGKTFFSKWGSRTLAVYFIHTIIITIFTLEKIELRVYQYLIIAVIVTIILSLKCISIPFNKFMKIDFHKK